MEYLYHYTSIEELALILKYRAIKLNSLTQMDDLQENMTADVKDIGRFVFISAWTSEEAESIPMWMMYSEPEAGVRIKLKKNPFVYHSTKLRDLANVPGLKLPEDADMDQVLPTFLDLAWLMKHKCYSFQALDGDILEEIIYTDDSTKLEPKVSVMFGDRRTIRMGPVGKYKSTYWAFQKEYRYMMNFMSMDFSVGEREMDKIFNENVERMLEGQQEPPFKHFYLDIDPEAFEEMEILLSPQLTLGNRLLLEAIVEKYNPKAKLVESVLLGKI